MKERIDVTGNKTKVREDLSDYIYPPYKLRLDTIAKLITGHGVVAAVCSHKGRFYYAHNEPNDRPAELIEQYDAFFKEVLQEENKTMKELVHDNAKKMEQLINASWELNIESKFKQENKRRRLKGQAQMTDNETKAERAKLEQGGVPKKRLEERLKRVVEAFGIDAPVGTRFPDDVRSSLAESWEHINENGHAEMLVLDRIDGKTRELQDNYVYVGVSKLCCRNCSIAIKLFNEKAEAEKARSQAAGGDEWNGFIGRRGAHGTAYGPWYPPRFVETYGLNHPVLSLPGYYFPDGKDPREGAQEGPDTSPPVSPRNMQYEQYPTTGAQLIVNLKAKIKKIGRLNKLKTSKQNDEMIRAESSRARGDLKILKNMRTQVYLKMECVQRQIPEQMAFIKDLGDKTDQMRMELPSLVDSLYKSADELERQSSHQIQQSKVEIEAIKTTAINAQKEVQKLIKSIKDQDDDLVSMRAELQRLSNAIEGQKQSSDAAPLNLPIEAKSAREKKLANRKKVRGVKGTKGPQVKPVEPQAPLNIQESSEGLDNAAMQAEIEELREAISAGEVAIQEKVRERLEKEKMRDSIALDIEQRSNATALSHEEMSRECQSIRGLAKAKQKASDNMPLKISGAQQGLENLHSSHKRLVELLTTLEKSITEAEDLSAALPEEKEHLKRYEKYSVLGSPDKEKYNFVIELRKSAKLHDVTKLREEAEKVAKEDMKNLLEQPNVYNRKGSVKLIPETNHGKQHGDNVDQLIAQIMSGELDQNSVICLERKQAGANLGMPDVVTLADALKHNKTKPEDPIDLPKGIEKSLIYKDAQLYNVARDKGIKLVGTEGKGLEHGKESTLYNTTREDHMSEVLERIANTGKQVVLVVGDAHKEGIKSILSGRDVEVEIVERDKAQVLTRMVDNKSVEAVRDSSETITPTATPGMNRGHKNSVRRRN